MWNIPVELFVILGDVSIIPVAVACPVGIGIANAVALTTMSAGIVSFGGVWSTTSTTCVAVAVLPATSFAVHVTVVFPNGNTAGALLVRETTFVLSVADAFPIVTVLLVGLVALTRMAGGGMIFGGVLSTMSTTWVALAVFPDLSFAVHSTTVLPSGNTFDALFVIDTGSMSAAVALPIGTVLLSSDVASKVTAGGGVSFGGVLSATSIT